MYKVTISFDDKISGKHPVLLWFVAVTVFLQPLNEGNAKFQLEVSGNKDVPFSPRSCLSFHQGWKPYPRSLSEL